jgi:DNA mismatch repair protein MutS
MTVQAAAQPGTAGRDLSILYADPAAGGMAGEPADAEPAYFPDLNLDQIARSLAAGREEYDLRPYFCQRLTSVAQVRYRQAVVRDLERDDLQRISGLFAERMRTMRSFLGRARAVHHPLQRSRLFLGAASVYCDAVDSLADGLASADPASAGLRLLAGYLTSHCASAAHAGLREDARRTTESLGRISYALHIRGNSIDVHAYAGEADYSAELRAVFEKFGSSDQAAPEGRAARPALLEVDDVEAGILERVARLFPQAFDDLEAFFRRRQGYVDPVVCRFDREVQFYLGYLDYLMPLRSAGLEFCYPQVADQPCQTAVRDTFDLVLAAALVARQQAVIRNDIQLREHERLLVVTGPNQGGKTTYARAFGQLHHLASLGLPIPGTAATLSLPGEILTHFEREEDVQTLAGKLQDDLVRLHEVMAAASDHSVIVLNEIFTSTAMADSLALSRQLLGQVAAAGSLCVCVTFLDELASFSPTTVSMVASADPDDPAVRTFRLVRRPADGFAYAEAVAEKHGLSYEQVRARVAR